ncbi:MAG: baseplate J/gp47 family protein [Oscillospiraceae bacterium]|nr:baseplate J/gp47 family protein [Oscillospiraceae bacterium]
MLKSINLDDQTFEEIMARALERLPKLAPSWTDYNAHDPGITVLELMAWYKEMQQYHLNFVGDRLWRKLLKLAGAPEPCDTAARCYVEIPPQAGARAALDRLATAGGAYLELDEAAKGGVALVSVHLTGEGVRADVTHLLGQPDIAVSPFMHGGRQTALNIELSGGQAGSPIRLWFEVADDLPYRRNPFAEDSENPRVIEFACPPGDTAPEITRDDTYALSRSGFIEFVPPAQWSGGGTLALRLADPGCEERVRLAGIRTGRYLAVQRETWARLAEFTVAPGQNARIELEDALSEDGRLFAFVRGDGGLLQADIADREGGAVTVDARQAAGGGANLAIVSLDAERCDNLLFDSDGLPGMELSLDTGGRRILRRSLALMCDTLCQDGTVRPALWRYTDDMLAAGARDRVFALGDGGKIIFGDGEHGAIVPRGENAILCANLELSYCAGGNIPGGGASFAKDGFAVAHTAASGGEDAKGALEAAAEFARSLARSPKCASLEDYERAALGTPGLRVAAAKAVAGYDPDEPAGRSGIPVVTVIIMPFGEERALPDARFLETARRHINAVRPICTKIKVIGPRHVSASIFAAVRARGGAGLRERLRDAASACFELSGGRGIGEPIIPGDVLARLRRVEGVYKVDRLEFLGLGRDCYLTPGHDVLIPQNAIAHLAEAEFDINLT